MSPLLTPPPTKGEGHSCPSLPGKTHGDRSVPAPYPGQVTPLLPPPIYICGPTASGKTAFAIGIALRHNGEIVNADAFQLYAGMEVLSAAPSAEEREMVPHHLYGVLSPSRKNDAQAYVDLATPVIREIQSRGKTPVVTGGSGLYLKFLTHGASPLPTADEALRRELDSLPLEDLVSRLEHLDPEEAARTSLSNRRYVSRALEICLLSGTKASLLRDQWKTSALEREKELRGHVIRRTREDLHRRINARTRIMLAGGAIDEVAALRDTASATCGKAIGFREILSFLDGGIDRRECEELISAATRQYARRQETWFRREAWLQPVDL